MQGQRGQAGVDAHVRADRAVEAAAAAAGQRQDELARAAPRVEPGHLAAPGLLLVLVVPAADVLDLAHVVVLDDRLPQRARLLRLRLGPLLPALPALALLVLLARVQVLLEPVHLAGRVAVLGRHAPAAALVVLQHARVARLAALAAPARRRRRPAVAGPVLLAVVLLALLLLQVVQALPVVLGDVRHMVVVFDPILINKCPIRIHLQQSGWRGQELRLRTAAASATRQGAVGAAQLGQPLFAGRKLVPLLCWLDLTSPRAAAGGDACTLS